MSDLRTHRQDRPRRLCTPYALTAPNAGHLGQALHVGLAASRYRLPKPDPDLRAGPVA
jgi:hypothetical protein